MTVFSSDTTQAEKQVMELYQAHYKDLYSYGVGMGFEPENVKDAIQDVFVKLHFSRHATLEQKTAKAYLLLAVRNRLIDLYRANRYNRPKTREEDLFPISVSVEEEYISDEQMKALRDRVQKFLEQLTAHQREIIFLRFIEELSYEDVARTMGMNIQTVRSQVFKALGKLRRLDRREADILKLILLLEFLSQ